MMEDKKCLLNEIMAIDFKIYDLALYLDTHPFDEEVLDMYQQLTEECEEKKAKYEEMYGPLTIKNAAGECEWKWIENPWPWERMV